MEDFSVAIIMKDEEKTLPKLLESLKGVIDIVCLDTGSSDHSVEIARLAGCNVVEVEDKFRIEATQLDMDKFLKLFGYLPSFKVGEKYFHFANARNYAASLTKNDWVFQPDADEVMTWDLIKVREAIQTEDHFCYRFCYVHNEDGSCALELEQSKFYRKSKLRWEKWVHEVLQTIPGQLSKTPKWCDFIYHHHWQESKQERGSQYRAGLELSLLENPEDDRNLYYYSRELFYAGEFDKSIRSFDKAIAINIWLPERNQAYVYQGLAYKGKKDFNKAIECFHKAMEVFDERREPFWELALLYEEQEKFDRALVYYMAALAISFKPQGYLNHTELYGWKIPDKIAYLYDKMGKKDEAKKYWLEAIKYNPPKVIMDNGIKWFYQNYPLISIVVPTVRPEGYERLVRSIAQNTSYPNYEIIKMKGEGTAIEKFNQGVKKSKGELIVYLADDTEILPGAIDQAFVYFMEKFHKKGLVIFNDGYWEDRLATHFLCSKNIIEELDGNIWYTGYHHVGADNELFGRLHNKNLISYCQYAKINHYHYLRPSKGLKPSKMDIYSKRIEEFRKVDEALLKERSEQFGFKSVILHEGEILIK